MTPFELSKPRRVPTGVREVIGAELAGEDDVLKWLHAATQPI